ncbi:hypothetical protein ACQUKI_00370 [Ralstonia pseudosolanacearum]
MDARLPALETARPEIADRLTKPAAQSEQFAAREDVAALRGERFKTIDAPTGKLVPLTDRRQHPSPMQAWSFSGAGRACIAASAPGACRMRHACVGNAATPGKPTPKVAALHGVGNSTRC